MKIILLLVVLCFGCIPDNGSAKWNDSGWVVDLFASKKFTDVLYTEDLTWRRSCNEYARKLRPIVIEYTSNGIRYNEAFCCSEERKQCIDEDGLVIMYKMAEQYKQ